MIYIDSRRKKEKTLKAKYPGAVILDITSKSETDLIKFSPFYPHGDIPVPFSVDSVSASVEGIWQGLKVFEKFDIDESLFFNATMRNMKRTVRTLGYPKGHRRGVKGEKLLDYIEARIEIFIPSYRFVLENKVKYLIDKLKTLSEQKDIVLLDYATNCDIFNTKKPLSHAYLVKCFIDDEFPDGSDLLEKYKELKELPEKVRIIIAEDTSKQSQLKLF